MEFDENLNPIEPNQGESWNTPPPLSDNPIDQSPPTPMPEITQTPPPPPEPIEPIQPIIQPDPVKDFSHPEIPPRNNNVGLIVATVLLAIIAIVSIAVNSNQPTPPASTAAIAQGLTVVGFGEAYATPDVAKIDFAVRTESKDLAISQKNNSETIAKIKNELARFTISAEDIKTIRYNISPEYDYFPARQPRLRGYSTYHSLRITVRKLEDADAIVQTLGGAGVTEINQVRFTVDDPSEVQGEAREQAISKAKEKAEQLANLSGAKLGKILSINESGPSPSQQYPTRVLDGFGGGAEAGLEEGSVAITSTVTIIYSLK